MRPVVPKEGQPLRIAIDATLREAAKNQLDRRADAVSSALLSMDTTDTQARAAVTARAHSKIYIESSDIRGKLMSRKAGSLLIFAVDASGSMALNRMNAAKGKTII